MLFLRGIPQVVKDLEDVLMLNHREESVVESRVFNLRLNTPMTSVVHRIELRHTSHPFVFGNIESVTFERCL